MHFRKHRPVSEPFSLFSGVQGVFQVDFEAVAVSCYIRTGQSQRSQPITVMSTILKQPQKKAVSASRVCLLTVGFDCNQNTENTIFKVDHSCPKGVSSVPGKHCIFKVMNGSGSLKKNDMFLSWKRMN